MPLSRKRSRETSNSISYPFPSFPTTHQQQQQPLKSCGSFSFLGEDISLQIHQQQLDIDNLIAQRMEKVRMELEEKRKRHARRIIDAIELSVMKRLKVKEDEIEKIGKLNWALEERVKSLCIENQIWRDLAQSNEATAIALRTNLEQVLAQRGGLPAVDDDGATVSPVGIAAMMDDAESCCGSTGGDENDDGANKEVNITGWCTLAGGAQDKEGCSKGKMMMMVSGDGNGSNSNNSTSRRLCRNCGKNESCVLVLPCRHLCLCTVCGSTLHSCPICKSFKTATVHVNMS